MKTSVKTIVIGAALLAVIAATSVRLPAQTTTARAAAPTCRVKTDLDLSQAARAAREGAGYADRHEGYGVSPWVLYESPDPLRAQADRAGVDAVIVETPIERIRNESYLIRYQGETLSPAGIARMRREASGTLGFIVYAHSRSEHDRGFMGAYSHAAITLADNRRLVSGDAVRFGPSSDFYSVGTFRDTRWTGALTFRFTLPPGIDRHPCGIAGTLHFSDGHGRTYIHHFRLADYR